MRKLVFVLAAAAAFTVPLAASASADERTCYTPHVGGFDTFEVCHYLPVDIEPTG